MNNLPFSSEILHDILERALHEDVGSGDVTTQATVSSNSQARAAFVAKTDGIVAGLTAAGHLLRHVEPALELTFEIDEGSYVETGTVFGTVEGPAAPLLTAERVMLNIMQRMSGIATKTRRMVDAAAPHPAKILDTRKTAPGLRALDKWAVQLGGGTNHRFGLYDMVLIKENHVETAGSVGAAIESAHRYLDRHELELLIEIETRTLDEVRTAAATGKVDRILLDNMVTMAPDGTTDTSMIEEALEIIDGRTPAEVSGNVTADTVPAIAATGVEYISSGALTHSVEALDISLLIDVESDE